MHFDKNANHSQGKVCFKRKKSHKQGSNMNMGDQVHSKKDIYHSQGIDGNNMGHVHLKKNVYEN
jgi:hypothetical protein